LAKELGINRPVRLLISPHRPMPMTWGLWRATVLLPQEAADWPPQRRRAVLLHELAHVKRRDCLTQLIAQVAYALHWFNPLAWMAWRQMQAERERACDDLVIGRGVSPAAYAQELVRVASALSGRWFGAAGIAMARTSKLEGRVRAILDEKRNRRAVGRGWGVGAAVVLAAVAGPLAMVRAGQRKVANEPSPVATRSSTEPAESQWRQTLPGGATIELVGVSENPSDHRPWWRPDGSPLVTRPYEHAGSSVAPQKNDVRREIAIHVDSPGEPVSFKWDLKADFSSSTVNMDHTGNGFEVAAVRFPAFQKKMTIRVGVADQPWKIITEARGPRTLAVASMKDVNVIFSGAYEEKDGVTIVAAHNQIDQATRVAAIDLDGRTHIGATSYGSAGNLGQITTTFHQLTLKQIRAFQFQMRPYHWVEFKNVAVYPKMNSSTGYQPVGRELAGADSDSNPSNTSKADSRSSTADGREYTPHGLVARATTAPATHPAKVTVPPGFEISVYDVRDMLVMNKGDEAYWPGVVPTRAQRLEQIIALIKAAIGPASWEEPAKISELKGQLVIWQRPEVQKQIGQLIERMRQGEKVDIVAHCIAFDQSDEINLPRPLAEAMKTDFKNGAVLLNQQQMSQAIPIASDPRMFDQKWARKAHGGKEIVVPHMELHNGQWSFVVIQTQRAYVAGFHPKKDAAGEVKYEPDIKMLLSGCYVDCQPLIEADGRSIMLAVHSRISTFLDFEENRLWPNTRPEQKLFFQQPVMATRDLRFVGAIPVGMTLAAPFDPVVKTPADSKVQMDAATKRRMVMLVRMEVEKSP
jgi:hypothetical protein